MARLAPAVPALQDSPAGSKPPPARMHKAECGLPATAIRAENVNRAFGLRDRGMGRHGTAFCHRFQSGLHFLGIGIGFVVENHQISGKSFRAEIFLCLKQLAHYPAVFDIVDPKQYNRVVTRNSLAPEARNISHAAFNDLPGRTERRVREEHSSTKTLEQVGFVGFNSQVMELYLGLRPGQIGDALKCGWVTVLVGQMKNLLAVRATIVEKIT